MLAPPCGSSTTTVGSSAGRPSSDACTTPPYPAGRDGRLFTDPRGGIFNDRAYLKIFHEARAASKRPLDRSALTG